ncbi:MAG: fdrA domain protein [Proteocatella sp.]
MEKKYSLLNKNLKIINIGLESFYKDLKSQKQDVVHLDWRPTAGGNKKLASMLSRLK